MVRVVPNTAMRSVLYFCGYCGVVTAQAVCVAASTVGATMLYLYPQSALRVLPGVYLGTGLVVWLFGRGAVHLGASGLVYGLVSYVFVAGLLRRDRRAIAASLLVVLMYGSLAWGVLPIEPGVSWETHLSAAVIGVLSALALRKLDIPPRKRYEWENPTEDNVDENGNNEDDAEWATQEGDDAPAPR
jgi:membrane associated rhomboid family serine protease